MRRQTTDFIITCEHASNRLPITAKSIFKGKPGIIRSHRAYDYGAEETAQIFSRTLQSPLLIFGYSRLAIDVNRSLTARDLHDPMIPDSARAELVKKYYLPFRKKCAEKISIPITRGNRILHLSIHSFTPVRRGQRRNCHIGILFDTKRKSEKKFSAILLKTLEENFPRLKICLNYPYEGAADGHTTALRAKFGDQSYLGIELEFNQAWLRRLSRAQTLDSTMIHVATLVAATKNEIFSN